tara:strand:+ start:70 stop:1167 length:1098 start_codon:yes stop_codon:yes gene_type:complete
MKFNRSNFFKSTIATICSTPFLNSNSIINNISEMRYKKLGNTEIYPSQIVMGTAQWKDETFLEPFHLSYEMGLNYIDTSPGYRGGRAEKITGNVIKSKKIRNKIYLANKISAYDEFIHQLCNEIFEKLPQDKKNDLIKKSNLMLSERDVLKHGYHYLYFRNQNNKFERSYLDYQIIKEYGQLNKWKPKIKEHMHSLVQKSLKACQTDYFDVLFCPHGVAMPEMLENECINEVMLELKKSGIIRASAVSMHNDVARNLKKAHELNVYDIAMIAYNIGNYEYIDPIIDKTNNDIGLIAMKSARITNINQRPSEKIKKLNKEININASEQTKGYIWALKNKKITCCISDMLSVDEVRENIININREII